MMLATFSGWVRYGSPDARRYREIYGFDYHDPTRYDLVLDTDGRDPEEVAQEIVARAERPA